MFKYNMSYWTYVQERSSLLPLAFQVHYLFFKVSNFTSLGAHSPHIEYILKASNNKILQMFQGLSSHTDDYGILGLVCLFSYYEN